MKKFLTLLFLLPLLALSAPTTPITNGVMGGPTGFTGVTYTVFTAASGSGPVSIDTTKPGTAYTGNGAVTFTYSGTPANATSSILVSFTASGGTLTPTLPTTWSIGQNGNITGIGTLASGQTIILNLRYARSRWECWAGDPVQVTGSGPFVQQTSPTIITPTLSGLVTMDNAFLEAYSGKIFAAGLSNGSSFTINNAIGDSGGTSSPTFHAFIGNTAGSANFNQIDGLSIASGHGSSGTATTLLGATIGTSVTSSGNVGTRRSLIINSTLSGAGNITTRAQGIYIATPTVSSTGDFTGAITGVDVANIGRASATTIIGFDVEAMTKGSGNLYAFRGQNTSGSGKYNIYMDGTAQNYMAGRLQVDGGMQFALGSTTLADDTYSGIVMTGYNAGANLTQWQIVYLDSSSTWQVADADGSGTFPAVGIVTATVSSGAAATVLIRGAFRDDGGTSWTVGSPVYLSTTAGAMTSTPPSSSGQNVQALGTALSAHVVLFQPSPDYFTN